MHEKVRCAQCHVKPVFADAGKNCQDCHADIHQRKMGTDCARCHTVQGWNIAVQQVKDHQNRFPLLGAHAAVQCEDCHKSAAVGQFQGLSTACASCHLKDFQGAKNPDHVTAQFAKTCESCHSFDSWLGARFDHNATGFPLTNGHANVPCLSCHINANYNLQIAPTDCGNSQCHLTTWQKTNNPVHSAAGPAFGVVNCANCHTTKGWDAANFNHTSTGFLLTNGHANVPCASCHINNNYNLTIAPTDCGNSGCHLTKWQQTNNPTHSTSGPAFALTNCSNCHTTKGWDAASFDHSATGFTLTGTHMSPSPTPCLSCHVSNNYTLNSTDCMGCHQSAWNSTPSFGGSVPNHITAGFPSTAAACASCHTITKWADGKIDHTAFGFPLTNSHALVANGGKVPACTSCHINNNYSLNIVPTDCGNSGCHLTTWQQTNNPVHPNAGAPFAAANCSTCHNTITWNTAVFDHSTTGWALTGSHQLAPAGKVVACTDCHVGNNYTFTAANTDCYGCHVAAWQSTPSFGGAVPNHITAGFPTSLCSQCHNTTTWTTSTFNHATTGFPLTNSHQLVANGGKVPGCASCHINNNYSLTIQPTDCGNSQCHLTTWQTTNNPTHPTAGAPFAAANCSTCHNTITWNTAVFDHSTTGWALTGSHQLAPAGKVVACTDCHVGNNYTFTAANTDCYGCHVAAWQSTPSFGGAVPNHITAGFPTSLCSQCHNTTTWTTSTFNHATTGFPLTNSHQLVANGGKVPGCASCHINNNYSLTIQPTDCGNSQCHLTTWQTTNNPTHPTAGAPFAAANCSTCHNTITWNTAVFNHSTTGWALTGSHQLAPAGKVVACTDCHVGNNYTFTAANTDCYGCHVAAWQSTPSFGGNVPDHIKAGFPTSLCSTCHDTLLWTDGKFDHSTTGWPLQGAHVTTPCASCHINSNYSLTAANTDCYGCHVAAWQSTVTLGGAVPNHVAAQYPTTCVTCHTTWVTTNWLGATFNHTWYKVPHHGSVCADCHINSANYATFSCIVCHTGPHSSKTQTDSNHGGVNGYSYGPTTCYNCHKQ
jgi:nitrate/TMAO reductase-like tetraheme cytochrome c subunit